MRRIISLITIAALLSVTSVPLFPKAAVCHAAEANTDCDSCHTDTSADHAMHAHNMHQDMHPASEDDGQMQHDHINKPEEMHKHQKKLSAAEKECRVECGCGCNRSVDGLPYLLAPHIAVTIQFETGEQSARIEPENYPALNSLTLSNPPPPPRTI